MKKRWVKQKMTLLVIRDADQSVKQLDMSKMLVVAVPLAAVLSISGFIVGLEMKSSAHIRSLESMMAERTMQMEITVKNKELAIQTLQNEIIRLSSQTQDMKNEMQNITELEQQLQQLIDTYGVTEPTKKSEVSALSWDAVDNVGGDLIEASQEQILQLAQDTRSDLNQIKEMLGTMRQNVSRTLHKAQVVAGTPTEWPTVSTRLTSSFGYRKDPLTGRAAFHAGIDIGGKVGDPVFAAADGKVITADKDGSHGKYVVIEHPNGLKTWYMHLHEIEVEANDSVSKGDRIAQLGNTGRSTGPHLHFQIVQSDKPVDPLPYVKNSKK